MVRGRGCNESFRAAVDRSYEAPLGDEAARATMDTGNYSRDTWSGSRVDPESGSPEMSAPNSSPERRLKFTAVAIDIKQTVRLPCFLYLCV